MPTRHEASGESPKGGEEQGRLPPLHPEQDEWDELEDEGPLDLEEQLDRALDRAFPPRR